MLYELKKISIWLILAIQAVVLLINGWLFVSYQNYTGGYILNSYESFKSSVQYVSENGGELPQGLNEQSAEYYELKKISEYPSLYRQYIDEMPQRTKNASLLAGGESYAKQNAEKTLHDFKAVSEISPILGIYFGIGSVFSCSLTDVLVFACLAFFCIKIICFEREKHLYRLILTTPSRMKIGLNKIFAIVFLSAVTTALLFLENLIAAYIIYGAENIFAPIQSSPQFQSCALLINGFQYIVVAFIIKIVCACALVICAGAILLLIKKTSLAIGVIAVFITIQYVLYSAIPITSNLNILKFINIFYVINPYEALRRYQNINIFAIPINTLQTTAFVIIVPLAFCALFIMRHFKRGKPVRDGKALFGNYADKLAKMLDKLIFHSSLFYFETKKLLFTSGGAIILLALAAGMLYTYKTEFRAPSPVEASYNNYMSVLSGEVTEKTFALMEEKREILNRNLASDKASYYLYDAQAFAQIEEQLKQISDISQSSKNKAILINDLGFTALFSANEALVYAFILPICIMLICSSVFAHENAVEMNKLLRICRRSSALAAIKVAVCAVIAVSCCALVFFGQLLILSKSYDFSFWNAPIQCVRSQLGVELKLSILQYYLIMLLVRAAASCVLAVCVCAISVCSKLITTSYIMCLAALLPQIISMLGVDFIKYFNVTALIMKPKLLLTEPLIFSAQLAVITLISIFIIVKTWAVKRINSSN